MTFWAALVDFMFSDAGRMADGYAGPKLLVFAAASAVMGLLSVFLDRTIYSVQGRSVFNLSYGSGFSTSFRLILLWGIGAGIGGFLGAAFNLLQVTRAACIGVGVGWPLVLPRLVESFRNEPKDVQPAA